MPVVFFLVKGARDERKHYHKDDCLPAERRMMTQCDVAVFAVPPAWKLMR